MFQTSASAHAALGKMPYAGAGVSVAAAFLFLAPLFLPGSTRNFILILGVIAFLSFPSFIYYSYRSSLGSVSALAMAGYMIVIFEIVIGGGIVIDALWIASLNQYRWRAFVFVESIYIFSLLVSMWMEFGRCTTGKMGGVDGGGGGAQ